MTTFYEDLGLQSSATPQEIRAAYRKLALINHPDKNPTDREAAAERFIKIQTAYETLSNPDEKNRYDESLRHTPGESTSAGAAAGSTEEKRAAPVAIPTMSELLGFILSTIAEAIQNYEYISQLVALLADIGEWETVQQLAERSFGALGHPVNIANPNTGDYPIHAAIRQGRADMVDYLISLDAKMFHQTRDGLTAAHLAAQQGNREIARSVARVSAEDQNLLRKSTLKKQVDVTFPSGRTIPATPYEVARIFSPDNAKLFDTRLGNNATCSVM